TRSKRDWSSDVCSSDLKRFGYFACGLSWIGNALLIDAQTFGWLYPLVFLASGAFFGLFAAFPAWLASYFKNIYAKYLAFASLWRSEERRVGKDGRARAC